MGDGARLAIEIDAPVEVVWDVLTDLEGYGRWNPMTPKVVGELAVGNVLQLTARVGRWLRTQDQAVYELVPHRRLVWSGSFGGELVRGVRTQTVEPLLGERTRYTTDDVFSGPLAGLTHRLYGPTLAAGFRAMADALKHTCEARVGRSRVASPVFVPHDLEQRRLPQRASWYMISLGSDLTPGAVRRTSLAGQDLVVWRTQGGRVGAARNVCGHMAARLAPGATVQGERLVCPHHGLAFSATGDACSRAARDLKGVPAREVGPVIMAWYHPHGAEPTFDVPDLDETGWDDWSFQTLDLAVHPQHVMEDIADARHFLSVHGYRTLEAITETRADGAALSFHGLVGWDPGLKMLPSVPVEFCTTAHGVGFQITNVSQLGGLALSRHLVLPTPIDDQTTRITLGVSARLGERSERALGMASPVARAAVHRVVAWAFRRDVMRDAKLWTQRHHHHDHLPPEDASMSTFHRWLGQFDAPRQEAA